MFTNLLTANSDPTLQDQLNHFYSRFDRKNTTKASSHSGPMQAVPPDSDSGLPPPPFTVRPWEVNNLFTKLNISKAAGPDNISPSTLKFCAEQLAPFFCEIYNHSLSQCKVPTCFKSFTIIPVPPQTKVSSLNDYRPVSFTLTSIALKVFERLVLRYLKTATDSLLDPHQFSSRANRSVEDAVCLGLHHILKHLNCPNTYARILFIDYSSAFNTIIPYKIFNKLRLLNVNTQMCKWILDFLLNQTRVVRFNSQLSEPLTLCTSAPQGCVLSPLLFTLHQ